jgi:hypothetical protein
MKVILTIALCLLVSCSALADDARKFDEYGNLPFSDEIARLDNLAIQLQHEPGMIAWYVVYSGRKICVGEARLRALRAKKYLVQKRGIKADRIRWMDGGYREDLGVDLWVWPRSMGAPTTYPTVDKSEIQIIKNCNSKYRNRQRRV